MKGIIGYMVAKVYAEVFATGPYAGDEVDPPLAGGSTSSPWGLDLVLLYSQSSIRLGAMKTG